jgi:2-octaprenyl-6-methoxyphenol hydroxylase
MSQTIATIAGEDQSQSITTSVTGTADKRKVAIVGGGPAGMTLALALRHHGIAAEIFEARERAAVREDTRVLALSEGSRQILDWLGVWPHDAATPINTIHISHRGSFGRTVLHASELAVPALGWVLPATALIATLDAAVSAAGIAYHAQQKVGTPRVLSRDGLKPSGRAGGTAAFALTAWAEGAVHALDATTRDYGQHAVVCTVRTAQPHAGIAWERFTNEGPVALLPLGKDYAVVLTCAAGDAAHIVALDDANFLDLLQQRFGTRHRFISATVREHFPLTLRYRNKPVGDRQMWLGNAAQTLHPVAGQGFNLALRDVWDLAQTLHHATDPGSPEVLAAYARQRQPDRRGAIGFTNLLIDVFAAQSPLVQHARGAGLLALDLLPPLKNFVAQRMMFGARAW